MIRDGSPSFGDRIIPDFMTSLTLAIEYKSGLFQPTNDLVRSHYGKLFHPVTATGILMLLIMFAAGVISDGRGSPCSM